MVEVYVVWLQRDGLREICACLHVLVNPIQGNSSVIVREGVGSVDFNGL